MCTLLHVPIVGQFYTYPTLDVTAATDVLVDSLCVNQADAANETSHCRQAMIFKLLYIITINNRSPSFHHMIPCLFRMDYHFTLCFIIFVNMKATKNITSFKKHKSYCIHQSKISITYYYLRICINSHKQHFQSFKGPNKVGFTFDFN